ncbi:MAG: XRE family transcriptional regulator [Bacillota bacterium]|nr:XRE family transcriptional regulator [Bacillota bacterium]
MPNVNPAILRWARETAGFSETEAVAKLGIRAARGVEAVDRLRELETGAKRPSRPMLVKMAKQYRRPLLVFYLADPPRQGDRGQDFRTLPQDHAPEEEALLDALIRDVQARQSLIRSAMLDEDDVEPLPFIGSAVVTDGVGRVVTSIRETLGLPLEAYRAASDIDEAFGILRDHTEEAGVFVLLLGNLGSHHTNIDLETFRGFALADQAAPFLVINDQDHHGAWSFTLLHELTHLWLGQTGVSGGRPEKSIERFCNDVASEFLMPGHELEELVDVGELTIEVAAARIGEFALARKVSHSMVAYKLHRSGTLSAAKWEALNEFFRERWFAERERRRGRARESEGGPNYYVVRRHRLGSALVELTARLMATGALTTSKAGAVLGVKPKNVPGVIGEYRARAS